MKPPRIRLSDPKFWIQNDFKVSALLKLKLKLLKNFKVERFWTKNNHKTQIQKE